MAIQIPTYFSRTAPRVVDRGRTSPELTGLPVAEGLRGIANELATADVEAERKVAEVDRFREYLSRTDRMSEKIAQLKVDLDSDPDHKTYYDRAKKGISNITDDTLSGVNDSELQKVLISELGKKKNIFITNAIHDQRKLTVDNAVANGISSIEKRVRDGAASRDSEELTGALGGIDSVLTGLKAGGAMSEVHAGKIRQAARTNIYTTLAMQLADQEPDRFLSNHKEGLYKEHVDPIHLEDIRRYAMNRDAAASSVEAAAEIWEKHGPKKDEDPINEDLMVRGLEAKFGGDRDRTRLSIASLKEKVYAHDKGVTERRAANLSEIWKASLAGKRIADIIAMPQYTGLDGDSQRLVKEHLEDRAWTLRQRAEDDPGRKAAQHEIYWRYSQPEVLAGMSENAITALYPNLGVTLTDKLMGDRRALDNPHKLAEAKIDQDDFNHYARQVGIDPEDKQKRAVLGELKFKVENAIDVEQRVRARVLTREEKAKFMKRELTEVDVRVQGYFGKSVVKKKAFEVQYPQNIVIPKAEREAIEFQLTVRGIRYTEDDVVRAYLRMKE